MSRKNKDDFKLIILTGIMIVLSLGLFLNSCENTLMESVEKDVLAAGPVSTFRVIYDGNGNTGGEVPVDLTEYKSGDTVTVLTNKGNLIRDGYTYLYWNKKADYTGKDYTDGPILTITDSDITLYARWSPNSNTVVFNANGGSGSTTDQTIETDATANLIPNAFTMIGYTFTGWNTSPDGSGTVYADGGSYTMGTSSVVLYAQWIINQYSITFDKNDDAASGTMPDQVITYGTTSSLDACVFFKTGWEFVGWAATSEGEVEYADQGNYTMGSGDVTLYAKWLENLSITFDKNDAGATGTMPDQIITSGLSANLNVCAFSKPGWGFDGWATTSVGGVIYTDQASYTMGSEDVTLYAIWISDINSSNIGLLKVVPTGNFQRDSTSTDISVITSAFRISEHEITRAQFNTIMGTDPSDVSKSSGTDDPVQQVNWYHAIAFCNKLSIAEGLDQVYSVDGIDFSTLLFNNIPTGRADSDWDDATADWSANGYRLPTEMEWMWAAMGALDDYAKPFAGSNGSNVIGDYAVFGYYGSEAGKTTTERSNPVGSKLSNELGLYDMSGNVWEWCWDWYAAYQGGTLTDYRGAASGSNRVKRGGSWYNYASYCPVAYRYSNTPTTQTYYFGFRVVRP